jgi:hypothetical protein
MSKAVYVYNSIAPNADLKEAEKKACWSVVFYVPTFLTGKKQTDSLFRDSRKDVGIEAPTDLRFTRWESTGYGFNILIFGFGISFNYMPASMFVV